MCDDSGIKIKMDDDKILQDFPHNKRNKIYVKAWKE
jgi:hypothetical protein